MNRPAATTTTPASTCHIRVAGHLGEHWSAWLDGFALTRGDDGTTVINGPVTRPGAAARRARPDPRPWRPAAVADHRLHRPASRDDGSRHPARPLDNDTSWRLWSASACAANCTQPATHCTGLVDGLDTVAYAILEAE
jgi:hypothetical protein